MRNRISKAQQGFLDEMALLHGHGVNIHIADKSYNVMRSLRSLERQELVEIHYLFDCA